MSLKFQKRTLDREVVYLKQHLRAHEVDQRRKDELIKRLSDELKKTIGLPNEPLLNRKINPKSVGDFRRAVKECKADLATKDAELLNLKRDLKYVRIQDLEDQLDASNQKCLSLQQQYLDEKSRKPSLSPEQLAFFESQVRDLRQVCQQLMDQN